MASEELLDTGVYLEVPEKDRLDKDDPSYEDANEDEFHLDFSDVPDGEVKRLSTANLDEED